jgi:putative hemolysin
LAALDGGRINKLYDACYDCRGGDFARAVLDYLDVRLEVAVTPEAVQRLAEHRAKAVGAAGRPLVVVADHPFGALDGIALLAWGTSLWTDFKLMANGMLQRVEPLRPCLLGVDPSATNGAQGHNRTALHAAYRHVQGGGVLGLFPTGRVAHWREARHPERVRWRPQVVKMLRHLGAPMLSVHFEGRNSWSFYLWGCLGWRVRSLRLPHEVFARRGSIIRMHVDVLTSLDGHAED